jgi:hypothetical protein
VRRDLELDYETLCVTVPVYVPATLLLGTLTVRTGVNVTPLFVPAAVVDMSRRLPPASTLAGVVNGEVEKVGSVWPLGAAQPACTENDALVFAIVETPEVKLLAVAVIDQAVGVNRVSDTVVVPSGIVAVAPELPRTADCGVAVAFAVIVRKPAFTVNVTPVGAVQMSPTAPQAAAAGVASPTSALSVAAAAARATGLRMVAPDEWARVCPSSSAIRAGQGHGSKELFPDAFGSQPAEVCPV